MQYTPSPNSRTAGLSSQPGLSNTTPPTRPQTHSPAMTPLYLTDHKRDQQQAGWPSHEAPFDSGSPTDIQDTKPSPSSTPLPVKSDSNMTIAERARERSLLDDPLANLLDASHVECKRCKKKIKLSSKSAFDTFHWRNHRMRCLRTPKKKGKAVRPSVLDLHKGSLPAPSIAPTSPVESESRGLQTPPLMSDSDDGHNSDRVTETASPVTLSHPLPSPLRYVPTIRQSDVLVDDYITRLHPEGVRPYGPLSTDHWQNWTWSQLKQPHFPSRYDRYEDDDDDTMSDRLSKYSFHDNIGHTAREDLEAANTLSSLARSH